MRVLVLMHKDCIPPEKVDKKAVDLEEVEWATEYDVVSTLKRSGHDVRALGVVNDLRKIRDTIDEFKPNLVFNLLEEFSGEAIFDQNVVSYLELLKVPYTGCNPRGLILGRDKALAKKILAYHRIRTAKFRVFPRNRPRSLSKRLQFPLIVKCLNEEASLGLSQASVVYSEDKLRERIQYINENLGMDAIAEEFIEGREYYVGVLGNYRLQTLPVWELKFKNIENPEKQFYSQYAKFNKAYRGRHGITTGPTTIPDELQKQFYDICKRTYRALNFSGYARIDLRVDAENRIYVLEANPNPDIAKADDLAVSAKYAGISYTKLLRKILNLGLSWNPTGGAT